MRGYGQTDRPRISSNTRCFIWSATWSASRCARGEQAVIVGHDWGAPVAWNAALLRPDRLRGVMGLSVPFLPHGSVRPTTAMPQTDDAVFYQLYFQAPGVAEAELERDPRDAFRRMLFSAIRGTGRGATVCSRRGVGMVPRAGGLLSPDGRSRAAAALADRGRRRFLRRRVRAGWVSRRAQLVPQHRPQLGAHGALRRLARRCPRALCRGDRDLVVGFRGMDKLIASLRAFVPELRETIMLPGCGHWTQQERAEEVNAAILGFLRELG